MIRPHHQQPFGRVLVVEDSLVNQRLMQGLLKQLACQVAVASNGREALEVLEQGDISLIFMDVQMPEMDGLTATRLIRERESSTQQHVPIIAITAGMDRQSCLEAGMDGYLTKPFRASELQEMLVSFTTYVKLPA